MEEKKPGDIFPKITRFPDGSSLVDYGDLVLPAPPPDRPPARVKPDAEADAAMEAAYAEEYAKRPGYAEWLRSPAGWRRFEL